MLPVCTIYVKNNWEKSVAGVFHLCRWSKCTFSEALRLKLQLFFHLNSQRLQWTCCFNLLALQTEVKWCKNR